LKRGKTSERVLACEVMSLTYLQIGILPQDVNQFVSESRQLLTELLDDSECDPEVRAACAKTYALAVFVANDPSYDNVSVLNKLESIFSQSYAKGDGSLNSFQPKVYELHSAALSSWSLLLSIMPLSFVTKAIQKHLTPLMDLLKSPDVDLRIAAGGAF